MSQHDQLAYLVLAAREDGHFRQQLAAVLQLPSRPRAALIHTALHEMTLRGEARDLREAFAILATEEGAAAALRALDLS